jgi:hypothetical protein
MVMIVGMIKGMIVSMIKGMIVSMIRGMIGGMIVGMIMGMIMIMGFGFRGIRCRGARPGSTPGSTRGWICQPLSDEADLVRDRGSPLIVATRFVVLPL